MFGIQTHQAQRFKDRNSEVEYKKIGVERYANRGYFGAVCDSFVYLTFLPAHPSTGKDEQKTSWIRDYTFDFRALTVKRDELRPYRVWELLAVHK